MEFIKVNFISPNLDRIQRNTSTARISLVSSCHVQESPSLNQHEIPLNKSSGGNSAADFHDEGATPARSDAEGSDGE